MPCSPTGTPGSHGAIVQQRISVPASPISAGMIFGIVLDRLAMNGFRTKARMEVMAHKTAEMTARYTHLSVNTNVKPMPACRSSERSSNPSPANFTTDGLGECGAFAR